MYEAIIRKIVDDAKGGAILVRSEELPAFFIYQIFDIRAVSIPVEAVSDQASSTVSASQEKT